MSGWYIKILDSLFAAEISKNSYGYRFQSSLAKNSFFKPWFQQWARYTKGLARIIEDNAFGAYWVVKVDIRSFYDGISLPRLRQKLAQGPSKACGIVIDSLDRESRSQYDVMCATMLDWCSEISGKDIGVPQGPAYARYLAELYLLQFDQDVEGLVAIHQGKYFRWVDDIFVFVPVNESAELIDSEMRKYLEALSLVVNEEKVFRGLVKDYRIHFQKYSSETKYFVDQVARNPQAISSTRRAQAAEALNDLIEGQDGVGIRVENASFFLTHLRAGTVEASTVLPYLMTVEHERGSFFKHVFDAAVGEWADKDYSAGILKLESLANLRLEVFLNAAHNVIASDSLSDAACVNIANAMRILKQKAFSEIAQILIGHILLLDPRMSAQIEQGDFSSAVVLSCIDNRVGEPLSDGVVDWIVKILSSVHIGIAINALSALVFENMLSRAAYGRAADKFFAVVLEALAQEGRQSGELECITTRESFSSALLQRYHMLCCFCSVTGSAKNVEQLKQVWRALIVASNMLPMWKSKKPLWLEKAGHVEIEMKTATALLTAVLDEDGVVPGFQDKHGVFEEYHNHLVVFVFAVCDGKKHEEAASKEKLRAAAEAHGMLYLEWILAYPDVALYPSKDVCLRNIVENDIVVLRKGDSLLIRQPGERIFKVEPSFVQVTERKTETFVSPSLNIVHSVQQNSRDLDSIFKDKSILLDAIGVAVQMIKGLIEFRVKHQPSGGGVPNVFTTGFGVGAESLVPAIPSTALCPMLLGSEGGAIRVFRNDVENAWRMVLLGIKDSGTRLLQFDHLSQTEAKDLHKLMPLPMDVGGQIMFLELFCEERVAGEWESAFEMDRRKCRTAFRFAKWMLEKRPLSTGRRTSTLIGKGFDTYLAVSGSKGNYATRMSFLPIIAPSDRSLYDLLRSLRDSLAWTVKDNHLGGDGMYLLQLIEDEFRMLAKTAAAAGESLSVSFDDNFGETELTSILSQFEKVIVAQGADYELVMDGKVLISTEGDIVTDKKMTVLRFGAYSQSLESLKAHHSAELRRGLVYRASGAESLLVLADDIVRTMFEMIRKRSELAADASEPDSNRSLVECVFDRAVEFEVLRSHPKFGQAVNIVEHNHFTPGMMKTRNDFEGFLIRWLSQFELEEASVLLEVVAAHQSVSVECVKEFIANVAKWKDSSIVFSGKQISDVGGVQRLFSLTEGGPAMIRSLKLEEAVERICSVGSNDTHSLVIVAETIISGSQLRRCFEEHYFADTPCDPETVWENRWHPLAGHEESFQRGMRRFSNVVIIVAAYTQRGAGVVKECLSRHLGISEDDVKVLGLCLNDADCFFGETAHVSGKAKGAFKGLLSDSRRMELLFDIDDTEEFARSCSKLDRANLIVRPNSTPKKCLLIFTETPKNEYIGPLFRKIGEHV